MVYQADDTPGLAVRGDATAYNTNNIYYVNCLKTDIGPVGIKENKTSNVNMSIYPNPSTDYTNIDLNLTKSANVSLTVTNMVGQQVISKDFGQFANGSHNLAIAVSQLTKGIYFFTIQAGNDRVTKKIVVE